VSDGGFYLFEGCLQAEGDHYRVALQLTSRMSVPAGCVKVPRQDEIEAHSGSTMTTGIAFETKA
jgi:hypothetical protein